MELAVLVQPIKGPKFRASCTSPWQSEAEGKTREEALEQLRHQIQQQISDGSEIVRLKIETTLPTVDLPLWPDDEITKQWLKQIREVRRQADLDDCIELVQ